MHVPHGVSHVTHRRVKERILSNCLDVRPPVLFLGEMLVCRQLLLAPPPDVKLTRQLHHLTHVPFLELQKSQHRAYRPVEVLEKTLELDVHPARVPLDVAVRQRERTELVVRHGYLSQHRIRRTEFVRARQPVRVRSAAELGRRLEQPTLVPGQPAMVQVPRYENLRRITDDVNRAVLPERRHQARALSRHGRNSILRRPFNAVAAPAPAAAVVAVAVVPVVVPVSASVPAVAPSRPSREHELRELFPEVVVEDDPRGGDCGSRLVDAASLRVVFHPAHVRERAVLRRPPRVRRDVREDVAHECGARLVMRRDDSGKVLGPGPAAGLGRRGCRDDAPVASVLRGAARDVSHVGRGPVRHRVAVGVHGKAENTARLDRRARSRVSSQEVSSGGVLEGRHGVPYSRGDERQALAPRVVARLRDYRASPVDRNRGEQEARERPKERDARPEG